MSGGGGLHPETTSLQPSRLASCWSDVVYLFRVYFSGGSMHCYGLSQSIADRFCCCSGRLLFSIQEEFSSTRVPASLHLVCGRRRRRYWSTRVEASSRLLSGQTGSGFKLWCHVFFFLPYNHHYLVFYDINNQLQSFCFDFRGVESSLYAGYVSLA